jgi:hypothetical protein
VKHALFPLVRLWKVTIYKWALREIDPMHPDVPFIVRELHRLENAK